MNGCCTITTPQGQRFAFSFCLKSAGNRSFLAVGASVENETARTWTILELTNPLETTYVGSYVLTPRGHIYVGSISFADLPKVTEYLLTIRQAERLLKVR